jgi:hypothetical protein
MRGLPFWMIQELVKSVTGVDLKKDEHVYIDHQSKHSLPVCWNEKGIDGEFLNDLKKFLLNDDVLIVGGNDNSSSGPCMGGVEHKGLRDICEGPTYVCRKEGDDWILFNRSKGTKIAFSFIEGDRKRERPNAPELIDLKITNFCPYACKYCYQDSTAQGKHARLDYEIYTYCEMNKVFEVAIGGGEPTMHPEFPEILEGFREHGVVPSFSTRNLQWMRDEVWRPKILKACGGFAFSVDTKEQIQNLADHCKKYEIGAEGWNDNHIVSVHHVIGAANSEWDFERILRECHRNEFPITLLGWKTTGRGKQVSFRDTMWKDSWLEIIKKVADEGECPRIGIDTTLAKNYEKEIKAIGIPNWLFYVEEGKFSMYYDAVQDRYGPSSFCDEDEYVKTESPSQAWDIIGKMQNGKPQKEKGKGKGRKAQADGTDEG